VVLAVVGLEFTYVRIQVFRLQDIIQAQKVKAAFFFKAKLLAFVHEVGIPLFEVESGAQIAQDADGEQVERRSAQLGTVVEQ